VQGELERQEKQLQVLKQSLKQDPTNLELANRYWKVVGLAQSGRYVRDPYRSAALASSVGRAAFARAYRELFSCRGEGPRMADFDDPVIQALEAYLPQLTGQDHSNVEWVLQTLV
jgi:hypothetical protein